MRTCEEIIKGKNDGYDTQMRRLTYYEDNVIGLMKKAQIEILNYIFKEYATCKINQELKNEIIKEIKNG